MQRTIKQLEDVEREHKTTTVLDWLSCVWNADTEEKIYFVNTKIFTNPHLKKQLETKGQLTI